MSTLLMASAAATAVQGATLLDGFEQEREWEAMENGSFEYSDKFATEGKKSLYMTSAAWGENPREWPSLHFNKPEITDFSEYEKLVLDVYNPTDGVEKVLVEFGDTENNTISGEVILQPHSFGRVELLMSAAREKGIALDKIKQYAIFTECPNTPFEIYADNLLLVKSGETTPELPASFVEAVKLDQAKTLGRIQTKFDLLAPVIEKYQSNPVLSAYFTRQQEAAKKSLDALKKEYLRLDGGQKLEANLDRALQLAEYLPVDAPDVLVVPALSGDRIYPYDMPLPLTGATAVDLGLAGNDRGSFQIAVLPFVNDLEKVTVSVGELKNSAGEVLDAQSITVAPVGHVAVNEYSRHKFGYLGWTPDVVLSFMDSAMVPRDTAQSFLGTIVTKPGQKSGVYNGMIDVSADGKKLAEIPLSLRVYQFDLPTRSMLPLTITTTYPRFNLDRSEEEKNADRRYAAEFLQQFRITLDHFYNEKPNDVELLKELHERKMLGGINLRYIQANPENAEATAEGLVNEIKPHYDAIKAAGLIEHAYLDGFDEMTEAFFPALETVAARLHEAFPEVPIMTTAYDYSLGTNSAIQSVDWWCPLIPKYTPDVVDGARKNGDKVWWYTSCDPTAPFIGMQLEDQPLEARLLMGAVTAKYRPDGFLFYETTYWRENQPIVSGPFTGWHPHSFSTYNGDGSWFYPGPNGLLMPSLRLENFRDGLDDYAMTQLLSAQIAAVSALPTAEENREWLDAAQKALAAGDELVTNLYTFTRDGQAVEFWSRTMAELIEKSPVPVSEVQDSFRTWGDPVY